MKLCAGFFLALLVIKMAKSEDVKIVAQAICGIIEETFVKKSERIEIISVAFGRQKNMDVLDEVLLVQQKNENFPIETRHIDLTQPWDHQLNKSAIFFFESPEAFYVVNSTMKFEASYFPKSFKILLYNEKLAEELIEKTKAKEFEPSRTFEKISFLSSRNDFVELNAITFYAPGNCDFTWSSVKINKFSGSLQMWETKEFFVTTIDQFYGCELKVYLGSNVKKFMSYTKFPNGTEYLSGPRHALLAILSKHLNFSYSFTDSTDADLYYEFTSLNRLPKLANSTGLYHITTTFMTLEFNVIATLGELYTPLEKLFMPFDKETWIVIGLVLVGALVLIVAVKHAPIQFRNFMFGRRLRTPALNLWTGIITGAQMFQPRRNWSRIALAVFLLMVFVMQNVYQNKMFDLLVGDGRKPPPQSLEDLVARNYTLFVHKQNAHVIEELHASKRPRMVFINEDEIQEENLEDPKFKHAELVNSEQWSYYLGKSSREKMVFQRIDENILTLHLGLIMFANDFLFDTFDQGIKKLLPTGMLDKGNIELEEPERQQPKEEDTEKALSMKEMGIAFKILIFGHAIAFVVFVIEKVKFHVFDRKREKKKPKPKLERRNAIRRKIKEAEIVVDDETKRKLKPKLERRNGIRRKIKEAKIVVDDETKKKKEALILEKDLGDLVVQTINEFDTNFEVVDKMKRKEAVIFEEDLDELDISVEETINVCEFGSPQ